MLQTPDAIQMLKTGDETPDQIWEFCEIAIREGGTAEEIIKDWFIPAIQELRK